MEKSGVIYSLRRGKGIKKKGHDPKHKMFQHCFFSKIHKPEYIKITLLSSHKLPFGSYLWICGKERSRKVGLWVSILSIMQQRSSGFKKNISIKKFLKPVLFPQLTCPILANKKQRTAQSNTNC